MFVRKPNKVMILIFFIAHCSTRLVFGHETEAPLPYNLQHYGKQELDRTKGVKIDKNMGSISVSGQLPTYPSPNPTFTLTCYQLTVVGLGEGLVGSCPDTDIDPKYCRENDKLVSFTACSCLSTFFGKGNLTLHP